MKERFMYPGFPRRVWLFAVLPFLLVTLALVHLSATTPRAEAAAPESDQLYNSPVTSRESNVERALARLQSEGKQITLILVSRYSTGLEGEIYDDLRERGYRATTGPDEGFDTRGESCYPGCVYVPIEDVNAISIYAWTRVLRHEYQHVIQATHNPTLAQDFRDGDGIFTPYAAFSEACADYDWNVAPNYRGQQRIDQVKKALGDDFETLVDRACDGYKWAYEELVGAYNAQMGQPSAFWEQFPPYR